MGSLARLAIRRRWLVVVGWLVLVVVAQGIASALGGAAYKDTFSLPHTETASVAKLLKNAGLDNQNGATGTVVLKNREPARSPRRRRSWSPRWSSCARRATPWSLISTPWQSIDCANTGAVDGGQSRSC